MTDPTVEWSSVDLDIVSVERFATVTARTIGTAIIAAAALGCVSDVTPIMAAAPDTTALHPNEPEGMAVIGYNDGSFVESNGSAFGIAAFGTLYGADNVSVVDDAENPTGSGKALEISWPASDCCVTAASFDGVSELYVMLRYVIEAPFDWGHKLFYLRAPGQESWGAGIWTAREATDNLRVIGGGNEVVVNAEDALVDRDVELAVEYHFVAPSSVGAEDGQVYVWVNGVLVGSNTGLAIADVTVDAAQWVGLQFYGRANETPTVETELLREFYISGK